MSCLPVHGRVQCNLCFGGVDTMFDSTRCVEGDWRITSNPLAWGSSDPEIVVLGFSKGPTQSGTLASTPHDQIAYKGGRVAVGKILAHLELIPRGTNDDLKRSVDRLISDRSGRFHFGSFIRCTVERREGEHWKGSGGGMLDKFVATPFGQTVSSNCAQRFLKYLPSKTRLVMMFGLGSKGNYVRAAKQIVERARPGKWRTVNEVAYTDGKVTFVHVEHFASQGALIPNWLGENPHVRSKLGQLAKIAVLGALGH